MATNSLISCSSCCSGAELIPPTRSSLISRRHALLGRPIMTVNSGASSSSSSSSSIGLHGMPILSAESSSTAPRDQEGAKPLSSDEKSLASEKNTGLTLQLSSLSNAPIWTKIVLGSVVLLAIPFLRKLLGTKDVMKKAENLAGVMETMAEAVEKAAEEIAEVLPDGMLKEDALEMEKIALLVDKNAEAAEYLIDKVNKAVEELETNLKPVIERDQKEVEDDVIKKTAAADQSKEGKH